MCFLLHSKIQFFFFEKSLRLLKITSSVFCLYVLKMAFDKKTKSVKYIGREK